MTRFASLTAALAAAAIFSAPVLHAQTASNPCITTVKKHHKKAEPAVAPCEDLRDQLAKQQAEIDALKAKLNEQQPAAAAPAETDPIATPLAKSAEGDADAAKQQATAANASAAAASAKADAAVADVNKLKDEVYSPSAIHYKNVTIQPGGFAAAESVFRTRSFNSNIATPFSATPYPNSGNYHITEFNGSAQQSRLSLAVTAPFDWGKAGAYFEGDFLGAAVTSNDNQTNSYVFRVRSFFGYATLKSGFTVQGGQMFTLATEDKKGVLAGQGAEALPPTIDPNYHVGFDFGRQYALRFADTFYDNKISAAFAIEQSQIILAGSVGAPDNFVIGGQGSTGGLFNSTGSGGGAQNYSNNIAPDLHLKVAADPGKGLGHYEVGGIVRFFRDRIYPQTTYSTSVAGSTTGAYNNTSVGAGIYASARVPATKWADVALKVTYGKGVGRYEASNLGDVTVRPDGVLVPLKTGDGLFELDLHPIKQMDVFFLAGAEYLQRTVYLSNTNAQVGYGAFVAQNNTNCSVQSAPTVTTGYTPVNTGSCTGATRYLAEYTPGITYRFFNSPTKGRLQFQITYSYLDRMSWQGWSGATTPTFANGNYALPNGDSYQAAQGVTNMFHTSLRYYIP